MAELSDLSVDELIKVIHRARGCGCCSDTEIPDGCPVDDPDDAEGNYFVDHTYAQGCSRDFHGLLNLLVEAAKKEA